MKKMIDSIIIKNYKGIKELNLAFNDSRIKSLLVTMALVNLQSLRHCN